MQNNVAKLRKSRDLTQSELAEHLGVCLSTVQNWEREKTDMTGYSLCMVCDYFNVSPDEVYGTGQNSEDWLLLQELIQIYKKVDNQGKQAILAAARGLSDMYVTKLP